MGSELVVITFQLLINMFHKIQILPAGIQKPISWNSPIYRWGQHIPAGLPYPPTPHPRFWSRDCLHIMKWLWSITLLKMMKMSYNPDIFCLFTLISHLKYLRWWVGATYPSWFILPPTWIFEQWLAMDSELLLIAVTTINGYVFTKNRYCLLVYENPFLEIHPYTGGGNISQLVYLTPHPRFWNGDCLHIMKWLWSITILKMMEFSYNPNIFCLFTLISQLEYLRWRVGGNLSQLVYLAPHLDFWAVIGYGFRIAANCCYNY